MDDIVKYLLLQLGFSLQELLFIAGPVIGLGILMQYLTGFIRSKMTNLLGWKPYVYITAFGTVVHESSHALVALLFMHKVRKITFFSPQNDGTLGSVEHAYNPDSKYQRAGNFFIGTAPLYMGAILVIGLGYWLLGSHAMKPVLNAAEHTHAVRNGWDIIRIFRDIFRTIWDVGAAIHVKPGWLDIRTLIFAYLVFSIGNHMTLSMEDLNGSKDGILLLIAAIFLFNLSLGWVDHLTHKAYDGFVEITGWVMIVMLASAVLTSIVSACIYLVVRSIQRIRA